ncbi:flippase [Arachidicoccus ginsenosidimutans]|uniref:hypothetical protein n=1 Tax=Arachidicoccus sp. BS20 TaxID=1850526 RepID=UPI0007F159F9|nr:hypothetical protein [Arachidicoccus sp. BS20]ANI88864.1 flippase [Arachidicoccus sp. BS20]
MKAANKVMMNTSILYGRMLVTMIITFFSVRIILQALGSSDYGIYSLTAGVIAMLSFLNTAMSTTTQRYLSFYQGKKDKQMQAKVFTNSLCLHIALGLFIVIALELLGMFLFKGFLKIPLTRIYAAKIIYHLMAATVFFSIVSVPFIGLLTAHENMVTVAIVNIFQSVAKLGVALFLLKTGFDKLIVYGILIEVVSILCLLIYAVYCFRKYEDCTLNQFFKPDIQLIKELSSFAGWNLFGVLCRLGRIQGVAVILNIFFGAIINAAYGIANQILSQFNFFSATLLRAINPQIMKSEGLNDRKRMFRLSMIASKFCFFLLSLIAVPCIFEMNTLLAIWLKKVPPDTVLFCCWILVYTLINQLTIGLQSAIQATGKIKIYQAVVGGTLLLNLPIAYLILYCGLPAYSVIISFSCIEIIGCCLRIYLLYKLVGMSAKEYLNRVIIKEVIPFTLSVMFCYFFTSFFHFKFRFILTGIFSAILFSLSFYCFSLYTDEKIIINTFINKFLKKISLSRLPAKFLKE